MRGLIIRRPLWLRIIRYFSPYPVRFWKVRRPTKFSRTVELFCAAGDIRRLK